MTKVRVPGWAIPIVLGLLGKLIIVLVHGQIWLGADGENYLQGVAGLQQDGLFSTEQKLFYWPAGYPLLLWWSGLTGTSGILLALVQAVVFAVATFFFLRALSDHLPHGLIWLSSILISLTPTLALTSVTVAYESLVASLVMFAVAAALMSREDSTRGALTKAVLVALPWAVMGFVQPRMLLLAVVFLIFVAWRGGLAKPIISLGLALGILVLPTAMLMWRNGVAHNDATISTNLGQTMALGAGETASGAYANDPAPLDCGPGVEGAKASAEDQRKVRCVLKWYLTNPENVPGLLWRKSAYYWSPFSGPYATGTYAVRNPWNIANPLWADESLRRDPNLIPLGRMWVLGQLVLLGLGVWWTRRLEFASYVRPLLISPVLLSWLISLGTLGDHRFRVPVMPLSLLLQAAGMYMIWKWVVPERRSTVAVSTSKKKRAKVRR